MNMAIGSRPAKSWKNASGNFALVLGYAVAMALSAALGATAFDTDENRLVSESAQRARLEAIMARPLPEPPDVVYYLVGSETEREAVETMLAEAEAMSYEINPGLQTRYVILVAADAVQETEAARTIGEVIASGSEPKTKVEVFDIRKQDANALGK
jgi:hypothetical protein